MKRETYLIRKFYNSDGDITTGRCGKNAPDSPNMCQKSSVSCSSLIRASPKAFVVNPQKTTAMIPLQCAKISDT